MRKNGCCSDQTSEWAEYCANYNMNERILDKNAGCPSVHFCMADSAIFYPDCHFRKGNSKVVEDEREFRYG